jgi:exonuclease III
MRIISWNCQGAFRKKADLILALHPDILIIQECEHLDKYVLKEKSMGSSYWYGDSKHKGICIYSFNDYKFELLPEFNPKFRYILPISVTRLTQSFTLFAIWAMNNVENHRARYIGQVWLAINYYADLLTGSTILIGDFNSNRIWDRKSRVGNHSDVVEKLANNNIHSTYHRYFAIEHGQERKPTFFLQRNLSKAYHIDYCFASVDFIDRVQDIKIGDYEKWIPYSDHVPVTIDFF